MTTLLSPAALAKQLDAALALVREIGAGVSRLEEVDPATLAALAGRASGLARATAGVRAALLVAAAEHGLPAAGGSRTLSGWLVAADPQLARSEAHLLARVVEKTQARELRQVRDAVCEGTVAPRDALTVATLVDTLAPVVTTRSPGAAELLPRERDERLAGLVHEALALCRRGASRASLRRFEVETLVRHAPDRHALDEAASVERCAMSTFRRRVDGMHEATVLLDEASMITVRSAIDALAAPCPGAGGAADARGPERRRADALVALAHAAASMDQRGPMGATTRVLVTMPLKTLVESAVQAGLVDPTDRDAHGDGVGGDDAGRSGRDATAMAAVGSSDRGEPITAAALRAMTCDAEIVPVVLDGRSMPLDVGRRSRLATAAQRDALVVRDGGCTFPECGAPPGWTRAHHIRHWADGGGTNLDNLTLLCGQHHRYVHGYGITGSVGPSGMVWNVERRGGRWLPASRQPSRPLEEPPGPPEPPEATVTRTRPLDGGLQDSPHAA